ncbi:MAG: hypothetical protein ISS48_02650 [Candidatus Aenigmarchaeota archaeon]|nr:hypothetical protein [Candidatus Aenigmarchaeota archaeon]
MKNHRLIIFNRSRKKEERFDKIVGRKSLSRNEVNQKGSESGSKPMKRMFGVVLRNQTIILWIVFLCFGVLLACSIFLPVKNRSYTNIVENVADRYLGVLTTWIGVIIGFYFGKEVSDYLFRKLEEFREKAPEIEKDFEILKEKYLELRDKYRKDIKDIHEIFEILKNRYFKLLDKYEEGMRKAGKISKNLEKNKKNEINYKS